MRYLISRFARLWQDEGGWILPVLAGAGLLGKFFGGAAKGAADGRKTQAELQRDQDAIRTAQYGTQQGAEMQAGNLDLSRKGFSENARGGRAKQAMIGDFLANWSPTSINVPGIKTASVSGGLQGALGEGGKAAGSLLNQQALMAMLNGDKFEGGKVLPTPGVTALPQPGKWEKTAGILGLLGGLGGTIGAAFPQIGGGGSGSSGSVPGIPFTSGMPSQMPGTPTDLGGMPDNASSISDIIARINAITNRSVTEQGGR
jgi:hypothetical protein